MTEALVEADVPLLVKLAAEIGSAAAVEAPEEELWRRRIGERFLLVELEPDTPAGIVQVVVERSAEIGLAPVFAHPERCRAVRSQLHMLDQARSAGAPVQVVAQSLGGRWGEEIERASWQLLESGRVDLIASDAHRDQHAGPRLRRVLDRVEARYGAPALAALIEEHPRQLLGIPPELR